MGTAAAWPLGQPRLRQTESRQLAGLSGAEAGSTTTNKRSKRDRWLTIQKGSTTCYKHQGTGNLRPVTITSLQVSS